MPFGVLQIPGPMQHSHSKRNARKTVSLKVTAKLHGVTAKKIYSGLNRGPFPLAPILDDSGIRFSAAEIRRLATPAKTRAQKLRDELDRSNQRNRLDLMGAISERLEVMGVPANCTSSSGRKIKKTFANLCAQIEDQCVRAEQQGIDFRGGFAINEAALAAHAARLAQRWIDADCHLDEEDLPWCERRPSRGNWNPKRWFKKVLLKRERQIADYFFKILYETGKFATPVICDAVLQSKQRQNRYAEQFAEEHQLTAEIDDSPFSVPFSKAASTSQKRAAKLYVRALGLEEYCTKVGLKGFFVTLTLPGSYHPNPSSGKNSWVGATPVEGHDEIHRKWRIVQREVNRKFGKLFGIRVEEPHEDGCPHWHLLVYVDPAHESAFRQIIGRYFGSDTAAKVDAIDPAKGRGASYIMKYIMPVLNATADSMAARYQAHRATWGKRAIQIFDHPGSSTLWDEMRRIKAESVEYQSLSQYARELHASAWATDYCQFLCVLKHNTKNEARGFPDGHDRDRKRRVSILYSEREVFACSVSHDRSTTTSKKIQGVEDHGNPIDTHPHDWKIERKAAVIPSKEVKKTDSVITTKPTVLEGIATVVHSYPSNAGGLGEGADLGTDYAKKGIGFAPGRTTPSPVGIGLSTQLTTLPLCHFGEHQTAQTTPCLKTVTETGGR